MRHKRIAAIGILVLQLLSFPALQAKAWSGEEPLTKIESDLEVTHEGTGTGRIGVTGDPVKEYDLLIRITRGGIPGDMSVQVSMDGGARWSEEQEITLAGNLPLYEQTEKKKQMTGLTAHFYAGETDTETSFVTGDEYRAYAMDPLTDIRITHKGDGLAELSVTPLSTDGRVFHLLEDGNYVIRIEILRSGSYGEAVMRLSADDGVTYTNEMFVPASGLIALPEIGVQLSFTGNEGSSLFVEGDHYEIRPERTDYLKKILIVLAVLIITAGILYYAFDRYMKSKLPGPSVYRIIPYKPISETEEQG